MIEFDSPFYWSVSAGVFVGLLAGMYLYVKVCWGIWEPALKYRVEQHYGVKINYTWFRHWDIDQRSWDNYQGNRAALWLGVTLISFVVFFGLVLVLLVALVGVWLVLAHLYQPPQ